jgi:hypothetical protein
MSARADYLGWRRTPAVGCTFARYLATRPDDCGQKIEEVSQSQNPRRVAAAIARCVDECVSDSSISAATLVLPGITTIEGLSRVALAVCDYPKWTVTMRKLPEPPKGNLVAEHIVREIPFGQTWCPSEVLAFGPFSMFPRTRRAPVVALEIFVGEPMQHDPKSRDTPTTKANLAHLDLAATDLTLNVINHMWESSERGREASLGRKDDNRAKAKVSFVISARLARRLGCEL